MSEQEQEIKRLVELLQSNRGTYVSREVAMSLWKIDPDNPLIKKVLVEILDTNDSEDTRRQTAESLLKIDPCNSVAVEALLKLIQTTKNTSTLILVVESLEKIDPGNPVAIEALVQLLRTSNNESILRQAAESLEKIDPGNLLAIEALVDRLRTSNNKSILRQAAESLEKIDPGNLPAIKALVDRLRSSDDDYILRQAAESLEKIGAGKPVVIEALMERLRSSDDKFILQEVVKILEKIGAGKPVVIEALVKLLRTSNNESILRKAAKSLENIAPGNPVAIEALIQLMLNTTYSALSRLLTAETLEKIASGNIKLIEKLRNLRHNQDTYTRWLISEILNKIDTTDQDSEQNQEQELSLFLDITRVQATVDYYFTFKDSRKAEFCYHRILACLDKMQTGTDIFTRRTLLESYLDTYQRIITFALKQRDFKRLFLYTEIFRNRYLVERLAKQDIPLPNTVSSELSQQIQEVKIIEKKALNIYTNKLNEGLPELELKQFAQQWDNAKADLEKLYNQVAKHEPEFITKTKVTPLYYSEVQEILASDTAIIEFFFTKYKLLTIFILPGLESPRIPDALSVDLSLINLEGIANNWLKNLSSKSKDNQEDIEKTKIDLDNIIETLSTFLRFNQLLNFIPDNIKHLIIVPHNYLHLFPIHSLWINKKENKRLIDKFSVSYFPSLQVWKICQSRQRSQQSLLAIENPTQDKDLIFAKAEIASISQHQYFNQQETLTETNATIENILKNASKYNCLHFSGHGEYNFENPLHSYLMLSHNNSENLTLNTIFSDLHIPHTDLVILSACCTGVVDAFQPTEEHLGLPTGFLLAGAKAVIASQWKVNSIATAFLFDEFYRQLKITDNNKAISLKNAQTWLRGCSAGALRNRAKAWENKLEGNERIDLEVKLELLQGIPFKSPYYWAAFMLTGC